MNNVRRNTRNVFLVVASVLFVSCSLQKKIGVSANKSLINDPELNSAHIGISIYEPATNRYWFNYQADKFFTPASNTKIFSCYAGMKWLGDSLNGLSYTEEADGLLIQGTGDPTLLHPDYKNQSVISFLQHSNKPIYIVNSNRKVFESLTKRLIVLKS